MAVNYLHRIPGTLPNRTAPGFYYRFPPNPGFAQTVKLEIRAMQYRYEWRAYWVPADQAGTFEQLAFQWKIGPCGRCRRGEECAAWTVVGAQASKTKPPDDPFWSQFEEAASDWFRQQAEFWKNGPTAPPPPPPPPPRHDDWSDAYSYAYGSTPPRQHTYGRKVDPPVDEMRQRFREERERRRRERDAEQQRYREERERQARQEAPRYRDPRAIAAELLGIGFDATIDEIRRAARRLALLHHPDRGGDATMMTKVLEARDVMLGKETRRSRR